MKITKTGTGENPWQLVNGDVIVGEYPTRTAARAASTTKAKPAKAPTAKASKPAKADKVEATSKHTDRPTRTGAAIVVELRNAKHGSVIANVLDGADGARVEIDWLIVDKAKLSDVIGVLSARRNALPMFQGRIVLMTTVELIHVGGLTGVERSAGLASQVASKLNEASTEWAPTYGSDGRVTFTFAKHQGITAGAAADVLGIVAPSGDGKAKRAADRVAKLNADMAAARAAKVSRKSA